MLEQEFDTPGDALIHYGVKGMKWGQRKVDGPEGVPPKINKAARADAEEHTRAKLFYGEGAGTRRKLIKAKVEEKSKNPLYKKAFDHHVDKTDLNKRAEQAQKERKSTDRKKSVKKTAKGVGHIAKGNNQYANLAATVIAGGALAAHNKGVDKALANHAKVKVSDVRRRNPNVDTRLKNFGFK